VEISLRREGFDHFAEAQLRTQHWPCLGFPLRQPNCLPHAHPPRIRPSLPLPHLDWVVGAGPAFDLVVVAGDSLSIRSAVSLEAQSVVMLRYLSLLQSAGRVAVSSGNHDHTGPDAHGEQGAALAGRGEGHGYSDR